MEILFNAQRKGCDVVEMTCIRPEYVAKFRCDGRICGSHCCRDWSVPVDPVTHRKYMELGRKGLEEDIAGRFPVRDEKGNYPVQLRDDGCCPFLQEDCLCRMQATYGEDYLSDICYSYPRVNYRVGDTVVQSLTMSCPVALQSLLEQEEPLRFHKVQEEVRLGWYTDVSDRVQSCGELWQELQLEGIHLLQNRELELEPCLFVLLLFYQEAQSCLEGGKGTALPRLLESVRSGAFALDAARQLEGCGRELCEHARIMVELFHELYGMPANEERLQAVMAVYDAEYPLFMETFLHNRRLFFENYLANEFFLRFYPYAYKDSLEQNARVFLLAWKVVECALLMMSVKSGMDPESVILGIARMTERLDHHKDGMEKIRSYAREMGELGCSAFAEKILCL